MGAWLAWLCLFSPAAQSSNTAPALAAAAWVLMDQHSGRILAQHGANTHLSPGALTKLMTTYLVYEHLRKNELKPDSLVPISAAAAATPLPRLYLRAGEQVTLGDLLQGMIVHSANDAAVALAELVAGSESAFVQMMNTKAEALNLANSRFLNASGVAAKGQHTTALNLAHLTSALIRDFPRLYQQHAAKDFAYKGVTHHSRNALLWRKAEVDGVLSGFCRHDDFSLAASATHDGMRLIAIVLDAPDDSRRIQAGRQLLDYGFNGYETRLLYQANAATTRVRVWLGNDSVLPVGLERDLYVTIPRGTAGELQARLTVNNVQYAPKQRGERVGSLDIYLNDALISERPLVALKDIKTGNPLQRALDNIQLWFK